MLCMNVELHVCVGVYCKEHHLTALSHCGIIHAVCKEHHLCMNVELHVCVGVYCKEHHLTALSHCGIIHAVYECRTTCVCGCVL